MTSARDITELLIEEGINARAHFQVWWGLRNLALPDYYSAMSESTYVDFFRAANSGHYVLFFHALSKIFDRDPRAAGIAELKNSLIAEGHSTLAAALEAELAPYESHVRRVLQIRNRAVAHNEHALPRHRVYELNGITPDEVRDLIDATSCAINTVAGGIGVSNIIFEGNRTQEAILRMLETLERGRKHAA
jgi:hypothetical protein